MARHAQHTTSQQTKTRPPGEERTGTGRAGGALDYTCPSCGHHVPAEVTRHKTLGIYVPVWRRGTCHNPDCSAAGPERQR
ncbi:hypothetical protein [Streptomyces rochei]|uniref:hypothetical protein n=1 Tax=Streptomyces rochei TaxID=1928 RepID=UPI0036BD42BB